MDALLTEYDVDRETAAKDVREFVEQMESVGILE